MGCVSYLSFYCNNQFHLCVSQCDIHPWSAHYCDVLGGTEKQIADAVESDDEEAIIAIAVAAAIAIAIVIIIAMTAIITIIAAIRS